MTSIFESYLLTYAILAVLVTITLPFIILFHELGHAIPAMLFTSERTLIYVGSYGNTDQSCRIQIGRLGILIKYNPFRFKRAGFCIYTTDSLSNWQHIIIVISGSLFSVILTFIICYIVFFFNLHGALKVITFFAICFSIVELYNNLRPRCIIDSNGEKHISDGAILRLLISKKKYDNKYAEAITEYENNKFDKAAVLFRELLDKGYEHIHANIYTLLIDSYIALLEIEKAHLLQQEFKTRYELDSIDYYLLAYTSSSLGFETLSNEYCEKSLELDPDNTAALNMKGYSLIVNKQYTAAITLLDKAILLAPNFAYAYNNRGHAKIETGAPEEGLKDIQQAIKLDKDNAYAYRNLGIYHLAKNDPITALSQFLKAKEMNNNTHLIDEYIQQATTSNA
jgi:tetratricopeptide (TPR) repeat protein